MTFEYESEERPATAKKPRTVRNQQAVAMAYDINGDLHDVVLTVKETTKGEEAKNHINHRKRTAFKYS